MNFDDRAKQAGAAVSVRAGEIEPHRSGLRRRTWVAPAGMIAIVASVVLIAYAFVPASSSRPEQVITVAAAVDSVSGPIVAGFVSDTGEITVLTGDPASPTVERLRVNAGAPLLGIATIPEPRWFFDGRVIEYVSDIAGELTVVRVDVRTGRTTTQPYWEIRTRGDLAPETGDEEVEEPVAGNDDESQPAPFPPDGAKPAEEPLPGDEGDDEIAPLPDGAIGQDDRSDTGATREAGRAEPAFAQEDVDSFGGVSDSDLDDDEVRVGSIRLMSAAMSPSVVAVEDGDETMWWLSAFSGESQLFDQPLFRFLAPMEDGLFALTDGRLVVVDEFTRLTDFNIDGVEADAICSVAVSPNSEVAFGLDSGSVVLSTAGQTRLFDVGDNPVSDLAWAPTGETFIVGTTDAVICGVAGSGASGLGAAGSGAVVAGEAEIKELSVCNVSSGRCSPLDGVPAVGGALVRGIPTPGPPEAFSGIWPESNEPAADVAADADAAERWRFDPGLLAAEYATAVLGWADPLVSPGDGDRNRLPYSAGFLVKPSRDAPGVTIGTQQIGGDAGWLVVSVSAPTRLFQASYSDIGPITIGFSREGAATVEVVVSIDGVEHRRIAEEVDEQIDGEIEEVEFIIEGRTSVLDYYLILFSDAAGQVLAARSSGFGGALVFVSVG